MDYDQNIPIPRSANRDGLAQKIRAMAVGDSFSLEGFNVGSVKATAYSYADRSFTIRVRHGPHGRIWRTA